MANYSSITKDYFDETVGKIVDKAKSRTIFGSPAPYTCDITDTEGLSLFGTMENIYAAYDTLCTTYPNYFKKQTSIGKDASGTYDMNRYTLQKDRPVFTTERGGAGTSIYSETTYPPIRLIIESGIHGPAEDGGVLALYLAVKEILESDEPWANFIKNNAIIDVLPCDNPWGYHNNSSNNVNGKDLNRTFLNNVQQENTNIINYINSVKDKGLIGMISSHITPISGNQPYYVAHPNYKFCSKYVDMVGQISSITQEMGDVLKPSTVGSPHFVLWRPTPAGQLHEYIDSIGLLGGTWEVYSETGMEGFVFSKALAINIIQSLICMGVEVFH